jgi:hypothetical protein
MKSSISQCGKSRLGQYSIHLINGNQTSHSNNISNNHCYDCPCFFALITRYYQEGTGNIAKLNC